MVSVAGRCAAQRDPHAGATLYANMFLADRVAVRTSLPFRTERIFTATAHTLSCLISRIRLNIGVVEAADDRRLSIVVSAIVTPLPARNCADYITSNATFHQLCKAPSSAFRGSPV